MTAFFQNLFQLLSGPMGAGIIGILVLLGIMEMGYHKRAHPVVFPLIAGGAFYGISWITSSVLSAGAG